MILCQEGKVKNLSWQMILFSHLSWNYQLTGLHEPLALDWATQDVDSLSSFLRCLRTVVCLIWLSACHRYFHSHTATSVLSPRIKIKLKHISQWEAKSLHSEDWNWWSDTHQHGPGRSLPMSLCCRRKEKALDPELHCGWGESQSSASSIWIRLKILSFWC